MNADLRLKVEDLVEVLEDELLAARSHNRELIAQFNGGPPK